jgi:small-conductance mechanosensitive channel
MRQFLGDWQTWLSSCGIPIGIVLLALIVYYAVFAALKRVAHRTGSTFGDSLVRHGQRPAGVLFPLLAIFVVLPVLQLQHGLMELIRHVIGLGLIASTAWLIIGLTDVFDDLISAKYKEVRDNLVARKVRTQIEVLRRIVVVVVSFVTISLMLMTFPTIRHLGTSLLASAVLAGLVVGIAARSTLSNLIAGMQIALTQPIRLEDVVIVEGEYGWIEEINTT